MVIANSPQPQDPIMDEGSQRSAKLKHQNSGGAGIGSECGIAPITIHRRDIHRQYRDAHCRQWLAGLPPRVARCVLANGFESREAVTEAFLHGLFEPGRTPGIGKQAYAQIAAWLGRTPIPPLDDKPKCIAVTLAPETQAALKRLMQYDESPQAAINRVIVESEQLVQVGRRSKKGRGPYDA